MPLSYGRWSSSARTTSPLLVVVPPIRLTMISRLTSGRPRQFCVTWQNRRCSILFHLLVPGGKWHTWTVSPVRSATSCRATFHSRQRLALDPPPSAAMSSFAARRERAPPPPPPPP